MKKGSIQKSPMIEQLLEETEQRFLAHQKELAGTKEEIRAAYLSKWDEYFQQIIQMQKEGRKGPIAYIFISWLRSEILCGSYGFRLDACDKEGYMDEAPISSQWSCDILWKYYEEDMAYLKRAAVQADRPRLKEPEIQWLRMECAEQYHKLTDAYYLMTIKEVQELASYQQLKKTKEMKIYSGEYLGQSLLLHQAQEEKEELTEEQAIGETEEPEASKTCGTGNNQTRTISC